MKPVKYMLVAAAILIGFSVRAEIRRIKPGSDLNAAVQNSVPGDSLFFLNGKHPAHRVVIDKKLTLIGESEAVIDGEYEGPVFVVFADSVMIEGLHIKNTGTAFMEDVAAVRFDGVRGCAVQNTKIENAFFGIYLAQAEDCTVRNNEVLNTADDEVNSGNAIHMWKCERIGVFDNHVEGHRDGIYFEFVDDSEIGGNYSVNNIRYGLHFMFSNRDEYYGNTFENNGAGVAVMFSKFIEMRENRFLKNRGSSSYGILLKEITDGKMVRNTFEQNTTGIHAEGANRILIIHNDFIGNGKAIMMKGNCYDNEVRENNFLENTFEVVTDSKQNTNTYEGNYWSKYRGYDLDRDGRGDIPHRPVGLFGLLTSKIPSAGLLLHSFLVNLLESAERIFPQMTPDNLTDEKPRMKKIEYD